MNDTLAELDRVLAQRVSSGDPDSSYVARLSSGGLDGILRKVGEECIEVILAAKESQNNAESRPHLIAETADLWFHCLVMLNSLGTDSAAVLAELRRRFHTSGLTEKATRQPFKQE